MKLKNIALLLAATTSALALTACGNNDKKLTFMNYWNKDVNSPENINETLTYSVTFQKNETAHKKLAYTLNYGTGSYITCLQSTTDGFFYTTTLTIPVTYQYGSEAAQTFTDTVKTEVKFLGKNDLLKPVSSKKSVVSHSPVNTTPAKLSECYTSFEYEVNVTYGEKGNAIVVENPTGTKTESASTFSYTDSKYSYLDNETLLLALRSISSSTTSGEVQVYNPFMQKMQNIAFSYSEKTGAEFTHTVNGAPLTNKMISYRPTLIALQANNPGATQTAWIASTTTPDNNEHRNVMLYLKTPLSYDLGALEYRLTSVVNAN